ncbi:hypothetical protein BOTBODRAFT_55030 [Botryobasidium botryosum FD-172 SS1]|uniref:Uncharacterized protein n=1 Tax=Botryobasidium botryosum (strain FD-172 SS1) TaxID=930990 RepID=A0A067MSN4_BOTB1|nr:hypothetical protein BOTBODRAFT_55030 [Botryobasidium botryosum FD-172 SS1]
MAKELLFASPLAVHRHVCRHLGRREREVIRDRGRGSKDATFDRAESKNDRTASLSLRDTVSSQYSPGPCRCSPRSTVRPTAHVSALIFSVFPTSHSCPLPRTGSHSSSFNTHLRQHVLPGILPAVFASKP